MRSKLLAILVLLLSGCGQNQSADPHADESEQARGEHGGRLLTDGELTLELWIYEAGESPEFRAWVEVNGNSVTPESATLSVVLTRLGSPPETVRFSPTGEFLRGDLPIREPHSFSVSVNLSHAGRTHQWQFDSFEGRTRISPEMARTFGLATELAGPAQIHESVRVFGRVTPDPTSIHQIRARFPGIVRQVLVEVGSAVQAGAVLAEIESDESLIRYQLKAPASGVVSMRTVNAGEQTDDRILFSIVDLSRVWAEFAVFPLDRARVSVGQAIEVQSAAGDSLGRGTVQWIGLETHSDQSVRVRTELSNAAGLLIPGMHLTANIEVATHSVALAVPRDALQSFRDFTVVYAQVGDEYEVRILELGRQDGERVEVLGGLEAGEKYVSTNSYLIKADIEKAGAAHDH